MRDFEQLATLRRVFIPLKGINCPCQFFFTFDYESMVALEPRSKGDFYGHSPPIVHPMAGTARWQSGISLDAL